jgi:hypothetical protein
MKKVVFSERRHVFLIKRNFIMLRKKVVFNKQRLECSERKKLIINNLCNADMKEMILKKRLNFLYRKAVTPYKQNLVYAERKDVIINKENLHCAERKEVKFNKMKL